MKKSLKGQTMVYQIRNNGKDEIFVGTRYWMLRVQFVGDQLKKDLAQSGLFSEGALSNGQMLDTPPNVENIFPKNIDQNNLLIKTSYIVQLETAQCRVFLLPDGTNVFANETYVSEIEAAFQATKKSPTFEWSTLGPNQPIIYGNRLALVLPIRGASTDGFKVTKI